MPVITVTEDPTARAGHKFSTVVLLFKFFFECCKPEAITSGRLGFVTVPMRLMMSWTVAAYLL